MYKEDLQAPANVRCDIAWSAGFGAGVHTLAWRAVPGATSYRIYNYYERVAEVTGTSWTATTGVMTAGAYFTVTAVQGTYESIPSAPIAGLFMFDPSSARPGWYNAPNTPTNLSATPEWNQGAPRNLLTWQAAGGSGNVRWNVWRGGVRVPDGQNLRSPIYLDVDVTPGTAYTYTVTATGVPGSSATPSPQETSQSASASCTTLSVSPAPAGAMPSVTGVTITAQNDDSVKVSWNAVTGARGYRVRIVSAGGAVKNDVLWKYSGMSGSVVATFAEVNGCPPTGTFEIVTEALDKPGPFCPMDGQMPPGSEVGNGSIYVHINGQGDPSNLPLVIARSAPLTTSCTARSLAGAQSFFDNFRASQPVYQIPVQQAAADRAVFGGSDGSDFLNPHIRKFRNDKWDITNFVGDQQNGRNFFVMSQHAMNVTPDGGTPGANSTLRVTSASVTWESRASADISGGKVLHVTMEVDAFFDSRRWCDIGVIPATDTLIDPAVIKLTGNNSITLGGSGIVWSILDNNQRLDTYYGDGTNTGLWSTHNELIGSGWGPNYRRDYVWGDGFNSNGDPRRLDWRHKIDLYVSTTRAVGYEEGRVIFDKTLSPALPFTSMKVFFAAHVYHTELDRVELLQYDPIKGRYWSQYRPFSDERHWDNMGFEVVTAFPT